MNWYQKAYMKVFPLIHLFLEFVDLVFKFRYLLSNKAVYYDVIFWLLKSKLVYRNINQSASGHGLMDMLNKPLILMVFVLYKGLAWYYSARRKGPGSAPANK